MENIFTWTEFNESYNKPRVGGKKRLVIINQMTKIIYSK